MVNKTRRRSGGVALKCVAMTFRLSFESLECRQLLAIDLLDGQYPTHPAGLFKPTRICFQRSGKLFPCRREALDYERRRRWNSQPWRMVCSLTAHRIQPRCCVALRWRACCKSRRFIPHRREFVDGRRLDSRWAKRRLSLFPSIRSGP